jgi:hypothetical protein
VKHTPGLDLAHGCVLRFRQEVLTCTNTPVRNADGPDLSTVAPGVCGVAGEGPKNGGHLIRTKHGRSAVDMMRNSGQSVRTSTAPKGGNTIFPKRRGLPTNGEKLGLPLAMLRERNYIAFTMRARGSVHIAGKRCWRGSLRVTPEDLIMSRQGQEEENTRRQILSCVAVDAMKSNGELARA